MPNTPSPTDNPTRNPSKKPTPVPTPVPTPSPTDNMAPQPDGQYYGINFDLVGVSREYLYQEAKETWENIIVGDVQPDITGLVGVQSPFQGCAPYPAVIDDLHICAKVSTR